MESAEKAAGAGRHGGGGCTGSDIRHWREERRHELRAVAGMEKEAAGIYLTGDPLSEYDYLSKLLKVRKLWELSRDSVRDNENIKLMCVVRDKKIHNTKKGAQMCFLTLEDGSGEVEAVVFPDLYLVTAKKLVENVIVYISGKIAVKDESVSVICDNIVFEEDFVLFAENKQLCIKTTSKNIPLEAVEELCRRYGGKTKVCFYLIDLKKLIRPLNGASLRLEAEVCEELCRAFKEENIGLI